MSNVPVETPTTGESKQESFHLGPEEVLETEITTKITDAQTSEPADVTVDAASTASSTVETKSEPIPPILTPPKQPAEVVVNRTTEVSSPSGTDSSVSFGNAKQRNDGEESDANSLAETKPMEEAIGTEEGTIQDGLKVNALSANNEENVVQREVDQVTKTVNNALERIQEAQLNESMQVQQEIFELGARQNAQTVQLNGILQSVVNIAQVLTSLQESQKKLEENEMQSSGNIVRSNDKDLEASGNQDRAEAQSRDLETSTDSKQLNFLRVNIFQTVTDHAAREDALVQKCSTTTTAFPRTCLFPGLPGKRLSPGILSGTSLHRFSRPSLLKKEAS